MLSDYFFDKQSGTCKHVMKNILESLCMLAY
jgi:hypothetical protein